MLTPVHWRWAHWCSDRLGPAEAELPNLRRGGAVLLPTNLGCQAGRET